MLDLNLRETVLEDQTIDVTADGVTRAFIIPQPPADPATTYFVRLTLTDSRGAQMSTNFYWLSTKSRRPRLGGHEVVLHADQAPRRPDGSQHACPRPAWRSRPSPRSAARTRMLESWSSRTRDRAGLSDSPEADRSRNRATKPLPVFWDANYFELLPGEKRDIRVTLPASASAAGARGSRRRRGTSARATVQMSRGTR